MHRYPDVLSRYLVPSCFIVQYRLLSYPYFHPSHLVRSSVSSCCRDYHPLRPDRSDLHMDRFLHDSFPFVSSFVIPPTRPHISSPRLYRVGKGKEVQYLIHCVCLPRSFRKRQTVFSKPSPIIILGGGAKDASIFFSCWGRGNGRRLVILYQGLHAADLTAAWVVSMQSFVDGDSH